MCLDVLAVENNEQDWIVTVQSADDEVIRIKEILSGFGKYNGASKGERFEILIMNHDVVGHCRIDKILQRIRRNYWLAKICVRL